MRVEIIENNANHFGMRIALVYEPLHLLRKVVLGSPLRHGHVPRRIIWVSLWYSSAVNST